MIVQLAQGLLAGSFLIWCCLPGQFGDFGAGPSLAPALNSLKMTLYQQLQMLQTWAGSVWKTSTEAFFCTLDLLLIHLRVECDRSLEAGLQVPALLIGCVQGSRAG